MSFASKMERNVKGFVKSSGTAERKKHSHLLHIRCCLVDQARFGGVSSLSGSCKAKICEGIWKVNRKEERMEIVDSVYSHDCSIYLP